jgi:putative CocE/NonD family hydrolase
MDVGVQAASGGTPLEYDTDEEYLRFFDRWLKGEQNGVDDDAPIKLFVMGEKVWRYEHEWPLARTQWTEYYLHSDGRANSARGDGTLSTEASGDERADHFLYDPNNPVPTAGGQLCCYWSQLPAGPFDQRSIEAREDVLVYSTPPLERDVEVTGPISVTLWASTSAPDTDFTAKLVDVHPDGKALNLTDGIIRARFRQGTDQERPITPNEPLEYTIDAWSTSNLFKAGHRIRLEISSSNFPRFDRNLNTGHPLGKDAEMQVAVQTILHDAEHPSRVTLPIIPR